MKDKKKTPDCDMREALVSHLYNEATPEESRRVVVHLEQCSICAEEMTAFERVRGMLQKWQVEELPEVYVVTKDQADRNRSVLALLKELFAVAPLWAKALGAVATAMLLLAIVGTNVSVGPNGFSANLSMFGKGTPQPPQGGGDLEQVRAELKTIVNSMIAESERQQSQTLKLQLVSMEQDLQNLHAADLAKLATRVQQQRDLIKSLERDIDRREGLALSDILFSEGATRSGGSQGGD